MRIRGVTLVTGRTDPRRNLIYRGATLVELTIAMVIIGVGVAAIMEFTAAATASNRQVSDVTVALSVCRAGHEWAASRPIDVPAGSTGKLLHTYFVWDSAQKCWVYPPSQMPAPILDAAEGALYDAQRAATYQGWTQYLTARRVLQANLTQTDTTNTSRCFEITVQARKNGGTVAHLTKLYMLP